MRPANERRPYIVTTSLIGWAHTYTDPWFFNGVSYTNIYRICSSIARQQIQSDNRIYFIRRAIFSLQLHSATGPEVFSNTYFLSTITMIYKSQWLNNGCYIQILWHQNSLTYWPLEDLIEINFQANFSGWWLCISCEIVLRWMSLDLTND